MKRSNFLFVTSLLCLPLLSMAQNYKDKTFKSTEAKSEFILYLAKNYCSNASAILAYEKKPKAYTHYIGGSSHRNVLFGFATVVHESCHHANSEISSFENGVDYDGIFITPEVKVKILVKSVYKSSELVGLVPKATQDQIFRFKTYIEGKTDGGVKIPFLRSVNDGIYGLMDEFSAYHQGAKAHLELYDYFKTFTTPDDYELMAKYIQEIASEIYAYHEFRLFMAWYLKYAEKHHPAVYKDCIENQNLKVAFTLIDQEFRKTIEEYKRIRAEIVAKINADGKVKAEILEDGSLKLLKDNGYQSLGGAEKEIVYLEALLTDEYKAALNQLYIEGLSLQNYGNFLEK